MSTLLVTSNPNVCGGDACIKGTRIMVWTLVCHRNAGRSDRRILADYPQLSQEDLNAAWAYYEENREEVDRQRMRHD